MKIGTTQAQRKLFFKLGKEKQKLIDQGFVPETKLLSERLGVTESEVVEMDQRLGSWDLSIDAPVKEGSDTEQGNFLIEATGESLEDQVAKKQLESLLHKHLPEFRKKLTKREREKFDQRILSDNPSTLQEIGDHYGISRERVRQVENEIIQKIRKFLRQELPDFDAYVRE